LRRAGFSRPRRRAVRRPYRKGWRGLYAAVLGRYARSDRRDAVRRGFADDNVIHRKPAAVARQGAIEFAFRHRRYFGDDGPVFALVEAFKHETVGVDRIKPVAAVPGLDRQRAVDRTLAVRQAAKQVLPGVAAITAA